MKTTFVLSVLALAAVASTASAQSLSCPVTTSNTSFVTTGLQTDCSSGPTPCTTKAGVTYDTTSNVLTLPPSAGNFQAPPGSAVQANVYFAATGDFDKDGWEDFAAADDSDKLYVMRNQTITCGTTTCSGTTSVAPATCASTATCPSAAWWNTLTNVRAAALRSMTTTGGTDAPLQPGVGSTGWMTPMASGDFDGDSWTDFAEVSLTYKPGSGSWPSAARLFMNTKNCHLTSASAPTIQPCGAGALCTGQPSNGACSGGSVTNGSAWVETNLSCTNTTTCPYYRPSFATYDLKTGAAIASGSASPTDGTIVTTTPGDFGPLGHPVQNMAVVDWDGDGDLDILYGHSGGTCPSGMCSVSGFVFYAGIDVWKNDCAQSAQWVPATKSCIGHIPAFTHTMGTGGCTSGSAACANADTLIPSTSHNTSTVLPNTNLGFDVGGKEAPGFAFADIDKDGDLDLVVGSPGCCSTSSNSGYKLRVYKGTTGSASSQMLDTTAPLMLGTSDSTHPGFQGGLTAVFVYDFSGDGYPDIITGSDSFGYDAANGGRTRYWKNTGTAGTPFGKAWPTCSATPATCASCSATCNPDATTLISESCGDNFCATNLAASPPQFPDFDMGLMLDYDHDPYFTKDVVMTNGNTSNEFYIFPNRADGAARAGCGTVASGPLPIPSSELTVSGACLTPTATVPANTSITYQLNNESPANWQTACTQTSSGFSPALSGGQCCVTFPNITGRVITWQAVMDSNTTDSGACTPGTTSPTISSVAANYTYTASSQHYKAGVIVSDGVTYVGSFTQPGNRGHLYAAPAGLTSTYYDFATKLDAQATRSLYTSDVTGATGVSRINFSPTTPSTTLQSRVGASSAAEATNIINWVLGTRFGVNNSGIAPTKLGAVMDSTPAILNKPFRPNWYSFLDSTNKALYDTFATTQATRVPLLLFASMDGFLHAVVTIPTSIGDTHNGLEAWGFVPPFIASNMKPDYTASCTPSCAAGTLAITSYPDGSPTLLDYKKAGGTIATAAIIGDGAGGTSVSALDVTSTINTSSYVTSGPTPLWSWQPGGAAAGKASSKVGVARSLIGGVEKFVVVAGTGVNSIDNTKGKVVAGYNLETGALMWQFEMQCALTSDISVFETDDTNEVGNPQIDGYADRAVFADQCGYVYKINPGQDLAGGYMDNTNYGTISIGTSNGKARYALFSTATTTGAIGGQRPIAGAIGARTDNTTDMVLFFGTGGMDSFDITKQNEFYAVYAKNGIIRNKITGACQLTPVNKCEKFYGGVVVTPDTVILEKSYDAIIGSPGSCDFGATHILAYALNGFANVFDISQIASQAIAAVSGPLYGDAGALYFATVSGEVKRVGAPRAATAGADTAGGTATGMGTAELVGGNAPFTLMGWRVVL